MTRTLFLLFIPFQLILGQTEINDVVTKSLEKTILIKLVKGKLVITENTKKTNQFNTSERLTGTNDAVYSSEFNKVIDIKARTINITDNKKHVFEVKNITESDVIQQGIFFSGSSRKNISYPNIKVNSKTELEYTKEIKDPHFLPSTFFTSQLNTELFKLSIIFPNNVEIDCKILNVEDKNLTFEEKKLEKKIVRTWVLKNIPKRNVNYDFSALHYVPQFIPYIKSYTYKDETIKVLESVTDLYSWYSELTSDINKTKSETVKQTTKKLISGLTNTDEIIKKIYYFVQNTITYIAFEDGMNGFIPRDAGTTLENKYGDCKDMANLLSQMLNYAGIEAHLTWIGTRRKPYSYYEIATPVVDNHMITTVIKDNDTIFLDATSKYLNYPIPSPFTQGKEALIGISNDTFKIAKVSETEANINLTTIANNFIIDENLLLKGEHRVNMSGYEKLNTLHHLKNKEPNYEDFIFYKLNIGKRKSKLLNVNFNNKNLSSDTLNIGFKSYTKNSISKIGNELYIKPSFDYFFMNELVKGNAEKFAKKIDFKSVKKIETKIKIPEDYSIKYIPSNTEFKHLNYSLKQEYRISEGFLIINKLIKVNTLKVNVQDILHWNNFIKNIIKVNKETVILKTN